MSREQEPALLIGAVVAAIVAAVQVALTIFTGGGFNDGVQVFEVVEIAAPIAAAFGIRLSVDSPATVERRERAAYHRGRRAVSGR